jgi:acyl carrier protein
VGLDTVELVMAFEEVFGLEIPNAAAARMRTVRDVIDYVAARKPSVPATACSTQQTFYVIRRALGPVAGRHRRLTPDTRLGELSDREGWPRIWERVRTKGGSAWPASVPQKSWWRDGPQTLGELTLFVEASRKRTPHPAGEPWTRDAVTGTVRQVIYEEQGIWKVHLDDSFVEDLGLD